MMLPFVQLEFAGLIGLPEGRYVSRSDSGEEVLVVQLRGAPRARRRPRPGRPGDPTDVEEVPLSQVMVVFADRLEPGDAESWLAQVSGSPEQRTEQVRSATRLLNRALHALRAAARDPLIQDVGRQPGPGHPDRLRHRRRGRRRPLDGRQAASPAAPRPAR